VRPMTFRTRFAEFVSNHIVADDPNPQPSRLDRMDGRGTVPVAGAQHDGFDSWDSALASIDGGSLNYFDVGDVNRTARVPS
jgi:hypothetical protein